MSTTCRDRGFLRLREGGHTLICSLRCSERGEKPEPVRLAAILADMLRPGWVDHAQALSVPIVRDGTLYRGFRIERKSLVAGSRWELAVLIPSAVGDEFDWSDMKARIDRFYHTIFRGGANA